MSFSDSESSSHGGGGGDYKFFRQISRDRLLHEMLGSTKTGDSKAWKILIMDRVTVKVMSQSCKMADITDQGISLVEELFKRREPMPGMDAIYFIQPSKENIVMFLSDMSGREPLYRKAFIFFSSTIPKELVNHIKSDSSVLPRIGALREVFLFYAIIPSLFTYSFIAFWFLNFLLLSIQMNMEYFPIDNQGFLTDHEQALETLYAEDAENSRHFHICLNIMATRIATVFASLKELPFVRYRAAKSTASRDLVPSKLAAAIWDCISKYKAIPNFPQTETCELLIVDRSVDQIAPIIHEWTYDAMCHDLLDMEGNKHVIEVPSKTGGPPEKKEIVLEDHDPVWLELRHTHIADASERLHEKMTNFASKNKAAQMRSRDGSELSTRDLQKIVQALPQYGEQVDKLSTHVELAGKINRIIRDTGLRDLGQLEQDLVFGDAGAKDVINFLRTNQDTNPENKLRLLMIYATVYPEKFEGDKGVKLMQLARLSPVDMKVISNMQLIAGSPENKAKSGSFSLKFDAGKTKQANRKDRSGEEETWQLFRFYPMIEELLEKLVKGDLSKSDYLCMNQSSHKEESEARTGSVRKSSAPTAVPERKATPHSMRSRRTATWARPHSSDDGYSSDSVLKSASTEFKKLGQRIFVFIIGGATRSELRVCHKLTSSLRREVVLGSTSFDDPPQYITKLKLLSEKDIQGAPAQPFKPQYW
ncbi:secretory 1A [Arabidopsis thaliana]|uniref:Secretory 1A n=2 Tax=Arabidopsis thaliana TaxID=3702 RepID=A0A1P8AMM7_ARATH|nr:secretory 1A [Arabidopsis thaliana]ANM57905.1 secretory 1A [Arabidopsis thaliana]|eukprot:NP_001320383.1 secretory 1A [Arabidopsis thaliana]